MHICFNEDYKFNDILGLEFETDRLIITPTSDNDLKVLSTYLLDDSVTKYLDSSIKYGFNAQEEAMEFLKSDNKAEKSIECTIRLKHDKTPIGKIDAMLYHDSTAAFGYFLGKGFQGKGYASEACYSFCNKIFNASDINAACIVCYSNNDSSIRLASRIFDYLVKNNQHFILKRCEGPVNGEMYEFVLKKLRNF